jgi:hypothetical protein
VLFSVNLRRLQQMPQRTYSISIAFVLAFLLQLLAPSFGQVLPLHYFIPPLVASLYSFSFTSCLWLAFSCGFVADVLFSMPRLGFLTSSYLFATLILFKGRHYFFKDSFTTLPLLSFFFSFFVSLFALILAFLFNNSTSYQLLSIVSELFLMPCCDALYAFFLFSLPCMLLLRYHRYQKTAR